jgi:3-oxoacyl-[acyl-carrier protein] reductase
MSDRYSQLVNTPVGKLVAGNVGLPVPVPLDRHSPGEPVVRGTVLFGGAPGGRLTGAITRTLAGAGAETACELRDDLRQAAADAGLDSAIHRPDAEDRFKALVFDATGIASADELDALHAFFSATIRRVERSGRVVVLGTPTESCAGAGEAIAQRALEGFTRSVAKEVRKGAAANLVLVEPGAEDAVEGTLRFLLSPRSAYVSGQVITVGDGEATPAGLDWERPLDGRVAVVTGASRGIGAAIAEVLARDGAHVVGVDVPPAADDLEGVMHELGGSALPLDITDDGAPRAIASHVREHGGLDVLVHNAGITRDKTLGRMDRDRWRSVLEVNLMAPQRITEALLQGGSRRLLGEHSRVVGVSSISGIAGNAGQTNYATSKAGVIGFVRALAPELAKAGGTVNAVAPGFIETQMTAAMPMATREAGRRMNSMNQGGLPADVAEAVAWLASPASGGVNGNVVRVCGQSLLGA